MRTRVGNSAPRRGIALIIVMLVIIVLSMMAAGLAYSMKVEMRLARNSSRDQDVELLARSGLEMARYVLGQQLSIPSEAAFDALNQKWAGGPGGTNDLLSDISLSRNKLGPGEFSVRIVDQERRMNINSAPAPVLHRAMDLLGVDVRESSIIVDSIEDWKDRDINPRINGTETDQYLVLPQPYLAKDGPIDDLSELLLVRGVTPELYWGAARLGRPELPSHALFRRMPGDSGPEPGSFGLVDLFTTLGARPQININTASREALQMLPGIDNHLAEGIVELRAGLDRIDGTEDDTPFHAPGELINVPGMSPQLVQGLAAFCSVRSHIFEAQVEVDVDGYRRRLIAILFRSGPRAVAVLNTRWE